MKTAPAIALLIAGAAVAGWLLAMVPMPARAAGAELPTLAEFALELLIRVAEWALAWIRSI